MNSTNLKSIIITILIAVLFSSNTAISKNKGSIEMNKSIVTEFFKNFSAGRIDQAFTLVGDNVSWWVPGDLPFSGIKTKTEYLQIVGAIKKGFPKGLKLNVISMVAEGNTVAAEVASEGDHYTGKKYENKYHFLIRIENDKIVEVKEYMDTLHLYQLIQPQK